MHCISNQIKNAYTHSKLKWQSKTETETLRNAVKALQIPQ